MSVPACIRCKSKESDRRPTRDSGHAVVCTNRKNCKLRQAKLYRRRRAQYGAKR